MSLFESTLLGSLHKEEEEAAVSRVEEEQSQEEAVSKEEETKNDADEEPRAVVKEDAPSRDNVEALRQRLSDSLHQEDELLKKQMELLVLRRDLKALIEQRETEEDLVKLWKQKDDLSKTREAFVV